MRSFLPTLSVLLVLVFASLLAGLAPVAATQRSGDHILRVDWEFPDTLEPQQTDFGQASMVYLAYEGLTRLDEEFNTVPAAAESWEFSQDGKVLTFHLREGLRYSDGTPLTAERFRYAVERLCDPHNDFLDVGSLFVIVGCEDLNNSLQTNVASPAAGATGYAAARSHLGVRALDDRTLEIRFVRPAPYFPTIAGGAGFLPVKQELVEAGGPEWWRDPANWVGNGPFQVTGIERGEDNGLISFVPNQYYWGGRAKLDGIEYIIMDGSFAGYQRGDLDIMRAPVGDLSLSEMEADPVLSQELVYAPNTMTGVFLLNNTREPFQDKKVREAFAYAFDRESYARVLEEGAVKPVLSWIPQGVPGAIETDAYAFDPDKARQALAESSYGGPENLPEIDWYVQPNDDPWFAQRDQWMVDQFRDVLGVELVLKPITEEENDAMLWVDSASWPQIASFFWYSERPDPHDWLAYWTCGSEYFAVYIGYCNPEFDALAEQVDSEFDPVKRVALAEEANRMLLADAPSIFAYTETSSWLVKPSVIGYSTTAPNQYWPGWWTPLTVDVARPD